MDMSNIPHWIIAAGVASVATYLMGKWKANRENWVNRALVLDDRLEERFGFKAPVWVHNIYNGIISKGAMAIDALVTDGPFIRRVIWAIVEKDPSKIKIEDVEAKFKKIDWTGDIDAQIPAEYKEVYNAVKESECLKVVTANLQKALPADKVPDEKAIREMIKVNVVANKIEKTPVPVTKDLLEKMIQDSKDRQAKLAEKK